MIALRGNVLSIGPFSTRVPPFVRTREEATYVEETFPWCGRDLKIRTWRGYTGDHLTCTGFILEPFEGRAIGIHPKRDADAPSFGEFECDAITAGFWREDTHATGEPEDGPKGAVYYFEKALTATEILDYLWWLDKDPHWFDDVGKSDET